MISVRQYTTTSDLCDHCKNSSAREPILQLYQSTRGDRNVIYVHKSCLLRKIAKAEKEVSNGL